jgi:hypothetical protein
MIASLTQINERENVKVHEKVIHIRRIKGRYVAEFKPSKHSNPIARVGVKPELFEEFAKAFKLDKVTNGKEIVYSTTSEEVFDLAILYACILRVLRDKSKARDVIDILLGLHPFELTFWNYKLINCTNRYEQDRVARAFLLLNLRRNTKTI